MGDAVRAVDSERAPKRYTSVMSVLNSTGKYYVTSHLESQLPIPGSISALSMRFQLEITVYNPKTHADIINL